MLVCKETQAMYESKEMQVHIMRQITHKNKQWIYQILTGEREQDRVIFSDPEKKFILLISENQPVDNVCDYIAILSDPKLKCLRDLRGEHVPLLKQLKSTCMKHLPANIDHCSIHYHPSVYQLHVHFRYIGQKIQKDLRAFDLDTIISNLENDTLYYKTTDLTFSVPSTSDVVRFLGKSCVLQYKNSYHFNNRVSCCRSSIKIHINRKSCVLVKD